MIALSPMEIKRLYDSLSEEMRYGERVDWLIEDIVDAWYSVLFTSQYITEIELRRRAIGSDINSEIIEVFKRGWDWWGRC